MTNLAQFPTAPASSGNSIVAANVRAELGYSGLSQGDLARGLGLSDMAMSRRLNDKYQSEFSASEILATAEFFNITPGELFVTRPRTAPTKKAPTANGEGQMLLDLDSNQEPTG